MQKQKSAKTQLLKLCRQKDRLDLDLIEKCLAKLTPNEVCQLQDDNPDIDITGYPLWAVSETWGFEVLWCNQHKNKDCYNSIDNCDIAPPPSLDELTPDVPLGQHQLWAIGDHL